MYPPGVSAEKIRTSGYGFYLTDLDAFLKKELGSDYVQTKKEKEMVTTGSGRSIQFTYKRRIEVDLLVSPNWSSQNALYEFFSHLWPHDDCQE